MNQKEIEKIVNDILKGKTTRTEVAEKKGISIRTLNNEILFLRINNEKLYLKWIDKFPYKPKEIKNINFVNLLKEYLKGSNFEELAEKYEISKKTINRRIKEFKGSKKTDKETGIAHEDLYNLYESRLENNLTEAEEQMICDMKVGEVKTEENIEIKEREIKEKILKFNRLTKEGYTKVAAAKSLGYKDLGGLHKDIYTFARIESEQKNNTKQKGFKEGKTTFHKGLKYDVDAVVESSDDNKTEKNVEDAEVGGR